MGEPSSLAEPAGPIGAPSGAGRRRGGRGTVAAVLLAAGEGRRYAESGGEGHKLAAPFRGRPLVTWAVEHALASGIGPVWVVAGAFDPSCLLHAAGGTDVGVEVLANPRWAEGMATSLQVAVARARTDGLTALVVGLADQPLVTAEAWRRVAAASGPIARASYDGVPGHPVRLAAEVWPDLPRSGDAGARSLLRSHPERVQDVACPGHPADVDTREDVQRWS
jgi:molybdenum cofactor cytidylyltransferase